MSDRPRATQRGSATPLVLAVLVIAGIVAAGVARLGVAVVSTAQAQAVADAAALAAVAHGDDAARRVAEANGADLVAQRTEDADAVVTVRVGGATATARARWQPAAIP